MFDNNEMLVNIKYGQAEDLKYNSENIKFRTPNLMVVFSSASKWVSYTGLYFLELEECHDHILFV